MGEPLLAFLAALIGYLLGSVSFARIVAARVSPGREIEDYESAIPDSAQTFRMQAVSATTVSMQLGHKWGGLVSLLDMLKVALPTLAFRLLSPGPYDHLIAAVAGLMGHIWPLYYGFKGGRGLSAIYGGLLAVDWLGVLVTACLAMFLGMVVLKATIVAYLGGLLLMIPWMVLRGRAWPFVFYSVLINVVFVVAMIPEIKAASESRRIREAAGETLPPPWVDDFSPMGRMMTGMMHGKHKASDRDGPQTPS